MEYRCCLLDTPGLVVHYCSTQQCLFNEWRGLHTPVTVRESAAFIISCLKAHPCTRILSDHTALRGDWLEAAPWVGGPLFGRLARLGIRYFAWVPAADNPADCAAMLAACAEARWPVVHFFPAVPEAQAWLQQQSA
jgi:hypothetical protein